MFTSQIKFFFSKLLKTNHIQYLFFHPFMLLSDLFAIRLRRFDDICTTVQVSLATEGRPSAKQRLAN